MQLQNKWKEQSFLQRLSNVGAISNEAVVVSFTDAFPSPAPTPSAGKPQISLSNGSTTVTHYSTQDSRLSHKALTEVTVRKNLS